MTKYIKITLFVLFAFLEKVHAQTQAVTMQFRAPATTNSHLDPVIYNYPGKFGGPDSLANLYYLRSVFMKKIIPTNGLQLNSDSIGLGGIITENTNFYFQGLNAWFFNSKMTNPSEKYIQSNIGPYQTFLKNGIVGGGSTVLTLAGEDLSLFWSDSNGNSKGFAANDLSGFQVFDQINNVGLIGQAKFNSTSPNWYVQQWKLDSALATKPDNLTISNQYAKLNGGNNLIGNQGVDGSISTSGSIVANAGMAIYNGYGLNVVRGENQTYTSGDGFKSQSPTGFTSYSNSQINFNDNTNGWFQYLLPSSTLASNSIIKLPSGSGTLAFSGDKNAGYILNQDTVAQHGRLRIDGAVKSSSIVLRDSTNGHEQSIFPNPDATTGTDTFYLPAHEGNSSSTSTLATVSDIPKPSNYIQNQGFAPQPLSESWVSYRMSAGSADQRTLVYGNGVSIGSGMGSASLQNNNCISGNPAEFILKSDGSIGFIVGASGYLINMQRDFLRINASQISFNNLPIHENPDYILASSDNGSGFDQRTHLVPASNFVRSSVLSNYLPLNGGIITGDIQYNSMPLNGSSLVNKSYVDNAITGISWKGAVRAKSTGNVSLSGIQTIDGVAGLADGRYLLNNQTNAKENGIWLMKSGAWVRVADADTGGEIATATVAVTLGTINKNTQWTNIDGYEPVIGTDNIDFGQISGAGTYTNGSGIDLTGNVFSLNSASVRNLISATSPLTYNSTSGVLGVQQSSGTQSGFLSSTDWTIFNSKQDAGNYFTSLTGEITASGVGNAAATINKAITPIWTGLHTYQVDALSNTIADAAIYRNTTPAVLNTQQNSPAIHFSSNGWGTAAGSSQSTDWRMFNAPVQGAVASGALTWAQSNNGGAYNNVMQLSGSSLNVNASVISSLNNTGTTSTDGYVAQNSTASTSASQVQYAPRIRLRGSSWNTTTAANNTQDAFFELRPASGATTGSLMAIAFQNNGAGYGDRFTFNNTGDFTAISTGFFGSTIGTAQRLGANVANPSSVGSQLFVGNNSTYSTGSAFNATGFGLAILPNTYNSTAVAGSPSIVGINTIASPTLTATNSQAITTASTFRVAGAPIAGTNVTIANPYTFEVAGGNSLFGGNITIASGANILPVVNVASTLGDAMHLYSAAYAQQINAGAASIFSFRIGSVNTLQAYTSTGNFIFQNGGTFTDDGINRLQIGGSIKASQFRLSALNTAPVSSTDTGTQGEIRVTSGYLYLCTAANTWVRSAFSTF